MKIINDTNRMEISTNGLKNIVGGVIFTLFGLQLVYTVLGQDNSIYPMLFGCLFAIVGVAILFFSKSKTIILEKEGNTTITSKYTIGMGQTKQESLPTADIAAVMLATRFQENRSSDGNTTPKTTSLLSLLLKNNDV